jgi:hypothetical protein
MGGFDTGGRTRDKMPVAAMTAFLERDRVIKIAAYGATAQNPRCCFSQIGDVTSVKFSSPAGISNRMSTCRTLFERNSMIEVLPTYIYVNGVSLLVFAIFGMCYKVVNISQGRYAEKIGLSTFGLYWTHINTDDVKCPPEFRQKVQSCNNQSLMLAAVCFLIFVINTIVAKL